MRTAPLLSSAVVRGAFTLAASAATLELVAACSRTDAPVAATSAPATAGSAPVLAAVRDDPYDSAKMDFRPPPAALSSERHTGAFASGSALNMEATLAPLDPSPVKDIRLDTTHKIIEIAPGVRFSAWTFGDKVLGR